MPTISKSSLQTNADFVEQGFRTWLFISVYALAILGTFMGVMTPILSTLPLKIHSLQAANSAGALSMILSAGSFTALISTPIFGRLSDETASPLGMRRPYLLLACGGSLLGTWTVLAGNNTITILLGWCAVQLSFNAAIAVLAAILVDQIPLQLRGTVSGIFGMCGPAGLVLGTYLVSQMSGMPTLMFWGPELFAIATILLFAAILPDKTREPIASSRLQTLPWLLEFISDLQGQSDFVWALASRFLLQFGSSVILSYQALYLMRHFHVSEAAMPSLIFDCAVAYSGSVAAFSVLGGKISDLIKRRKGPVLIASLIQATGLAAAVAGGTINSYILGIAVAGAGHGIYMGVDMALLVDVLPGKKDKIAKNLALGNVAITLSQMIAPAIGMMLLTISPQNYTLVFLTAGSLSAIAGFTVLPIKSAR